MNGWIDAEASSWGAFEENQEIDKIESILAKKPAWMPGSAWDECSELETLEEIESFVDSMKELIDIGFPVEKLEKIAMSDADLNFGCGWADLFCQESKEELEELYTSMIEDGSIENV